MQLPAIRTYLPPVRSVRPQASSGRMNIAGRPFSMSKAVSYSHRLVIGLEPAGTSPLSFDIVVRRAGGDNSDRFLLFKPFQIAFGNEVYTGRPGNMLKAWVRMPYDLFEGTRYVSEAYTALDLPALNDNGPLLSSYQKVSYGALRHNTGIDGFVFEFAG